MGKSINIGSGFNSTTTVTTLSLSVSQQPLLMPATAKIVTKQKGVTTNTVDDHISEDDISNSEGDNNEHDNNLQSFSKMHGIK